LREVKRIAVLKYRGEWEKVFCRCVRVSKLPADAAAGDQKSVETPVAAIFDGASFRVIGWSIFKAASPREAAQKMLKEMAGVK
jgi:orotidine-5'-phosphate decarboxylase